MTSRWHKSATLTASERVDVDGEAVYAGRYPMDAPGFRVHTLAEELAFVAALVAARIGRPVGIYPEIKKPAWHRAEGFDITAAVLDVLDAAGYRSRGPIPYSCNVSTRRNCSAYARSTRQRSAAGAVDRLTTAGTKSPTDYDALRSRDGLA